MLMTYLVRDVFRAIDSELSMRFPVIFPYLYKTMSPNDFFISGDSGSGYLNPTLLFPDKKTGRRGASEVTKSGEAAWSKWCSAWYEQFDLSLTGFLINGDQGPLTAEALAMYNSFSPGGVVITTGHDPVDNDANGKAWVDLGGTPVMHHVADLDANFTKAAITIQGIVAADRPKLGGQATFYILRNILKAAGYMVDVATTTKHLVPDAEWVDPYSMGLLIKQAQTVGMAEPEGPGQLSV